MEGLSLEQQARCSVQLQRAKESLPQMSREQLEALCLELTRGYIVQRFQYENLIATKWGIVEKQSDDAR